MYSGEFTSLGNSQASAKAAEIALVRAGPSQCAFWVGVYYWRALNNTAGVIGSSPTTSGLDADYAAITGYVSGTGSGAVYNHPRRMGIWVLNSSWWSADPTSLAVPDWVVTNSTYGPVGPDGVHDGYFTTVGSGGYGTGAVNALWRASGLSAYQSFLLALANHVLPDGFTVDTSPYIEFVNVLGESNDTPFTTASAYGTAADSTYTTTGYRNNIASMTAYAAKVFPHTNVSFPLTYLDDMSDVPTLLATFPGRRVALAAGDTFGATTGQNVPTSGNGLNGFTWGQAAYYGLQPPPSGTAPWVAGGTSYKGIIPYIGVAANTELVASYGAYYTPTDIFTQANDLGMTHLSYQYVQGQAGSAATANWLGNASSLSVWLTAPGTWSGTLDTIYNNNLSQTACPTAYTTGCNTN